jgi:hypothetical protein
VDDGVQRFELVAVAEDAVTQRRPVEHAVGGEYLVPPPLDDRVVAGRAGLHRLTRQHVGVDDRRPALREEPRDGRLAAGDVAGEADQKHREWAVGSRK